MNRWERWLDGLDSPGGHILVLVGLLAAGVAMSLAQVPHGDDVVMGTFGALLAVLRGTASNQDRQNGTSSHA